MAGHEYESSFAMLIEAIAVIEKKELQNKIATDIIENKSVSMSINVKCSDSRSARKRKIPLDTVSIYTADEINRKYSYKCTVSKTCSHISSSFGNEKKAEKEMRKHLNEDHKEYIEDRMSRSDVLLQYSKKNQCNQNSSGQSKRLKYKHPSGIKQPALKRRYKDTSGKVKNGEDIPKEMNDCEGMPNERNYPNDIKSFLDNVHSSSSNCDLNQDKVSTAQKHIIVHKNERSAISNKFIHKERSSDLSNFDCGPNQDKQPTSLKTFKSCVVDENHNVSIIEESMQECDVEINSPCSCRNSISALPQGEPAGLKNKDFNSTLKIDNKLPYNDHDYISSYRKTKKRAKHTSSAKFFDEAVMKARILVEENMDKPDCNKFIKKLSKKMDDQINYRNAVEWKNNRCCPNYHKACIRSPGLPFVLDPTISFELANVETIVSEDEDPMFRLLLRFHNKVVFVRKNNSLSTAKKSKLVIRNHILVEDDIPQEASTSSSWSISSENKVNPTSSLNICRNIPKNIRQIMKVASRSTLENSENISQVQINKIVMEHINRMASKKSKGPAQCELCKKKIYYLCNLKKSLLQYSLEI